MRNRQEIEKDVDSSSRNDWGDVQHFHADSEELQTLTLEVLLDIRDILMRPYLWLMTQNLVKKK